MNPRFMLILVLAALIVAVIFLIIGANNCSGKDEGGQAAETIVTEEATENASPGSAASQSEETEGPSVTLPDKKTDLLSHYQNLGVVTAGNFLNIREDPSEDATVIGKAWKGNGVEILEELENGWDHISSGSVDGYAVSDYIARGDEAVSLAMENCLLMAKVNAACLNVREEPTVDSPAWTQLNADELQAVVSVHGNWLEVYINETTGYISADYVTLGYYLTTAMPYDALDETTETRRSLVKFAEQFLGTPYVFGGTDPYNGIDCSGFTQYVYGQYGVELYRESYNQRFLGTAVASVAEAQPGDLMFYEDSTGTVDHVAIYIGSGRIVHACQSRGGVVITSYNYNTEPAYIRNVLGDR